MTDAPPQRSGSALAMCGVKLRECHAAIRGAEERASAMAEAGTMAESEYLNLCQALKTTYNVVQTFQDLHAKCLDMHEAAGKLIKTHQEQRKQMDIAKKKSYWVIGSMLKKNRNVAGTMFNGIVKKQRLTRQRAGPNDRVHIDIPKDEMDACVSYLFSGDTDDETWRMCVDEADRQAAAYEAAAPEEGEGEGNGEAEREGEGEGES